jgi:glutamate formiminotransferase/glutamate formiminotransferase/formiminotetrahydrofolate cyclodeaminase
VDVAPIVHLDDASRGAAGAEALVLGELIGRELEVPVLLYGPLAQGRTRAELRRGGIATLRDRIAGGELVPDFGPRRVHPTAGVTLVGARPPLVAFNLVLEGTGVERAREIAAAVREGGTCGLPGIRALGLELKGRGTTQLSFNVEDVRQTPLATLIEAVRAHARVKEAELVGLAPAAAFEGFPGDVPIPGFEPDRHVIERVLGLQVS